MQRQIMHAGRNWQGRPMPWIVLLVACLVLGNVSSPRAAELKGLMAACEDNKMCPWFKSAVKPPKGWIENEEWSNQYQALFLFLHGNTDASKPVIYVRSHTGNAAQSIEDYIAVAQQRWKAEDASNVIEAQDDLTRPDKPAIKVYLYSNPAVPDQPYELTAFMKDVDPHYPGSTFFFQIVLSSPSMNALTKAELAFYDLLQRL
jgi:hypothetical protein